jgi:hypothetical protein
MELRRAVSGEGTTFNFSRGHSRGDERRCWEIGYVVPLIGAVETIRTAWICLLAFAQNEFSFGVYVEDEFAAGRQTERVADVLGIVTCPFPVIVVSIEFPSLLCMGITSLISVIPSHFGIHFKRIKGRPKAAFVFVATL